MESISGARRTLALLWNRRAISAAERTQEGMFWGSNSRTDCPGMKRSGLPIQEYSSGTVPDREGFFLRLRILLDRFYP
jgi:hypothetical protein